ncbi:MAG: ferric reductase-like transmembrane domain-containing protein, partial [Paludibacteraceae bacterium]
SFLKDVFPLLFSTAVFALLFVLLSKSIKKYYYIYYTAFAIPTLIVIVPSILQMCGIELSFNFMRIPILGQILRDYIHMASLGHPLLVIIMYMGALDMRKPSVKKLMNIRKEISIMAGFPILTHSWIRTIHNFPGALKYFTNHSEFMENPRVTSVLGAGFTNTALVLGIVMVALFLVLWITSFDAVHKRLGGQRWKKVQKWAYVLYALLFIHAMGLQIGRMLGSDARNNKTELVAKQSEQSRNEATNNIEQPDKTGQDALRKQTGRSETTLNEKRDEHSEQAKQRERPARNETVANQPIERKSENAVSQERSGEKNLKATPQKKGHGVGKGLSDMNVSNAAKQWIATLSYLLIYGSYLILRVRKARKKSKRKSI